MGTEAAEVPTAGEEREVQEGVKRDFQTGMTLG